MSEQQPTRSWVEFALILLVVLVIVVIIVTVIGSHGNTAFSNVGGSPTM